MQAAMRLFITTDRKRLVPEGHQDGAFLYAAPGDEIPDSAADMFGLVDGRLGSEEMVAAVVGILRVAVIGAGSIDVAGFTFTSEWREFGSDVMDEGQLLAILKEPGLAVEGALVGDDRGWIAFPGRYVAIEALQEHVDYDLAHGRAHDPVGMRGEYLSIHPVEAAKALPADAKEPPVEKPSTPAPANTPAPAKESKPAPNKEAKPAANKTKGQ